MYSFGIIRFFFDFHRWADVAFNNWIPSPSGDSFANISG